jgi:hypothetical protein
MERLSHLPVEALAEGQQDDDGKSPPGQGDNGQSHAFPLLPQFPVEKTE